MDRSAITSPRHHMPPKQQQQSLIEFHVLSQAKAQQYNLLVSVTPFSTSNGRIRAPKRAWLHPAPHRLSVFMNFLGCNQSQRRAQEVRHCVLTGNA